jgi:hypothetical protein
VKSTEKTRDDDLGDIAPSAGVDEGEARLEELLGRKLEAIDRVSKLQESLVVGSVIESLVDLIHERSGVPLPLGVLLGNVLSVVVELLDLPLRLAGGSVASIVDGTVGERVDLVDELLEALVLLEVSDDLFGRGKDAIERTSEGLDNLTEEGEGVVGSGVGVDLAVGFDRLGHLLELVAGRVGVLADEAEEGVERVLVLGRRLNLVDDLWEEGRKSVREREEWQTGRRGQLTDLKRSMKAS